MTTTVLGGDVPQTALAATTTRTGSQAVLLWAQLDPNADLNLVDQLTRTQPPTRCFVAGPVWAHHELPPTVRWLSTLAQVADTLTTTATRAPPSQTPRPPLVGGPPRTSSAPASQSPPHPGPAVRTTPMSVLGVGVTRHGCSRSRAPARVDWAPVWCWRRGVAMAVSCAVVRAASCWVHTVTPTASRSTATSPATIITRPCRPRGVGSPHGRPPPTHE